MKSTFFSLICGFEKPQLKFDTIYILHAAAGHYSAHKGA